MNVSESNDLNTLLSWLFGDKGPLREVTEDDAKAAAARLADRAYQALYAGLSADDVTKRWPRPALRREAIATSVRDVPAAQEHTGVRATLPAPDPDRGFATGAGGVPATRRIRKRRRSG
jgi:hypothetical protein